MAKNKNKVELAVFMSVNFNYKTVYFYLLSLFGFLLIFALIGQIESIFVRNYSIWGIIICIASWIVDEQIILSAEGITRTGLYDPDIDNPEIHKVLKYRLWNLWILFILLLFSFIIAIISK